MENQIELSKAILFGIAVGDALGVPVEFEDRHVVQRNPVVDMRGFGSHQVPVGTFSDDSSLAFCLAESLVKGFDLQDQAQKFANWLHANYWTATGSVFDVGMATNRAIMRFIKGTKPELCGGIDEADNGNGSLMRILPLVLFTQNMGIEERYDHAKLVSSVTHGHILSVISCFYYLEFARKLIQGVDKHQAYQELKNEVLHFLESKNINVVQVTKLKRLFVGDIADVQESEIWSSGYVLHTLEASIWCLLTTNSYAEATLKAVNLGSDTDTTGTVTGGLAALAYGYETIPEEWRKQLLRSEDIADLATRYAVSLLPSTTNKTSHDQHNTNTESQPT